MKPSGLSEAVLSIDADKACAQIGDRLREIVSRKLHRRGVVVAISGGIDSSVCAALAVKSLGADRVYGLLLPERDSSPASGVQGRLLADHLGIAFTTQNLEPVLEAIGCYRARDEAIRAVFPDSTPQWKSKLAIAGRLDGRLTSFRLIVETPSGERREARMPAEAYRKLVAAMNYKQRVRKTVEYFHADRLHYAVVGTPNRLEYDQGFFVKNGDGSADVKPIAHLYKTQVYALARHLGLPEAIQNAEPTTDIFSLPQSQTEFYFSLPYPQMDLALWAYNHGVTPQDLAKSLGIEVEVSERIYRDIETKRLTTAYLHARPQLMEPVPEV